MSHLLWLRSTDDVTMDYIFQRGTQQKLHGRVKRDVLVVIDFVHDHIHGRSSKKVTFVHIYSEGFYPHAHG